MQITHGGHKSRVLRTGQMFAKFGNRVDDMHLKKSKN
jgi:hypothetical protein